MRDEILIEALVELCDDARTRDRAIESVDSWAREDRNGRMAATKARLRRIPAIAEVTKPGSFLFIAGSAGWGVDLDHWLPGFVREAEPLTRDLQRQEAQRFLDLLLSEGTAPIHVRTTLAGIQLEDGLAVNLPFGRLRAADASDFSANQHLAKLPPAAVFEYEAHFRRGSAPITRRRSETRPERNLRSRLRRSTTAMLHESCRRSCLAGRVPSKSI